MSSADLWEDDYPHGTVEGYDGGCRGGACPAQSIDMPCKRAKTLAAGDIRYNRLVAEGKTPAEIAAIIDGHDEPNPTPATSKTPVPKPPRKKAPAPVFDPTLVDDIPDHGWPETPAEVSIAESATTATTSEGPNATVETSDTAPTEDTTTTERDTPPLAEDTAAAPADSPTETHDEETPVDTTPLTTEKFTAGLSATGRTFVLRSIREWARANGFPGVPSHGRIPRDALAAFDKAHPDGIIPAAHTDKPAASGIEAHVARHREVRDWARANGWPELTDRGLIDPEIYEAYDAAHGDDVVAPVATPDEDLEKPFSADLDEVRERADMPPTHAVVRSGEFYVPEEALVVRPEWSDVTVSEDVERARSITVLIEAQNASLLEQVRASQQVADNALELVSDFRARDQVHRANLATAERKAHVEKTMRGVAEGDNRLLRARIQELEAQLAEATKPWWKRIL